MTFWQPFWILAAILEFKENNFQKNRFLGPVNIHLDFFYCFLRHLQAEICKFPEFGGHLEKMANWKKCSTFGVWLQTDLDSAAQNLMETTIKMYICLKTRSREINIDRGSDHKEDLKFAETVRICFDLITQLQVSSVTSIIYKFSWSLILMTSTCIVRIFVMDIYFGSDFFPSLCSSWFPYVSLRIHSCSFFG